MEDNYLKQAAQAKAFFLTFDQEVLIRRHRLRADENFLYPVFFGDTYRIHRKTGDFSRLEEGIWQDANSHGEVMTLLDLLCDSREDRRPAGTYRTMQDFGHQFHQDLGEKDPRALLFQSCPEKLRSACEALGGIPFANGDVAFILPVFEDLRMILQFWLGDEEFAPRLRFLWDSNADRYLKYETMYYAVDVLMKRLQALMDISGLSRR